MGKSQVNDLKHSSHTVRMSAHLKLSSLSQLKPYRKFLSYEWVTFQSLRLRTSISDSHDITNHGTIPKPTIAYLTHK
jgi:hypothetical protein